MNAIVNGRLILPAHDGGKNGGEFFIAETGTLLYEGKIFEITDKIFSNDFNNVIDARGMFVAPGFINSHIHGAAGADAMDGGEAVLKIARHQASTGVTALLPTTMTAGFSKIHSALDGIRECMKKKSNGARIIGAHLEGPFISHERCGAQAAKDIARADFSMIKKYSDVIRIITVAPEEINDCEGFYNKCAEHDIKISIGHSSADYNMAFHLADSGIASRVTHIFNGMPQFHHRKPGIIGAALDSYLYTELIADNLHVHPAAQRILWRVKHGRVILITDSMRATGTSDSVSELGGQKVYVRGNRAELEDGTLAGSLLTMDRAVKNFSDNIGGDLAAAVCAATKAPAESLGIYGETGSLEAGKRADFVIFDENLKIHATFINGKKVFGIDDLED